MNKSILLTAVIMLAVGLGVGYWLFGSGMASHSAAEMSVMADKEKQPLFYRSPMNPEITSPVPAKGPMGMDYIPVYDEMEADGTQANMAVGTVKIDPVMVQNIGVRTAVAKKMPFSRTIRTVGRVVFDEESMTRLHPKVEGWVEEIRVDKTGQTVNKNDILLSIYSPKLVATQQEYLLALNNLAALEDSPFAEIRQGAEDLAKSSRQRLLLLDVAEHQIQTLEQSREIQKNLHIHSPVAGTVIRIGSRQGQYVMPNTEMYMLVDLNQVWVYADVYEYELPWVKVGDKVEMSLASVPGKTVEGSLSYIYPYAESQTRTTKVRLVFDNRDLLLRPDMFADVIIYTEQQDNALVIPAEAVVRSGDKPQVFVVRGEGEFEPRIVTLGLESHGQVAVLDGVMAGEKVVTSAQFLIDSESKLREATAKMISNSDMSMDMDMKGDMDMEMKPGMDIKESMPAGGEGSMKMSDNGAH